MNKCVKVNYRSFFAVAGVYLLLPVLIFFAGYLKIPVAAACVAVTCLIGYLAFRDSNRAPDRSLMEDCVTIPVKFIVIASVFAVCVTVITGVGELVWTTYDHAFRRAILNDLINYKWPVIYQPETQMNPDVRQMITSQAPQGFIYYFTYWMPAALTGKLFGFTAANIFLILWNSLGIVLIIIGISIYVRRNSYASMFVLLCFSGLDVIPYYINQIWLNIDEQWMWVDGCVPHMSFVSNFNNMENVYHQAIPCYLIIILLLTARNNRSTGLIGSLMFAYSPWATFGMIVPCIVQLFNGRYRTGDRRRNIRNILSPCNIVMPVIILIIYGAFYMAKADSASDRGFTWEYYGSIGKFIPAYLILLAVEVLPVAALVFSKRRKDPMFWGAIIILLLCPLYKITESNDFTMRASMPGLFILAVFLVKLISDYSEEDTKLARQNKKRKGIAANLKLAALSVVLVGMAYVTYFMLSVIIPGTFMSSDRPENHIVSFGNQATPYYTEKISDQFFSENPYDTLFFKYLGKKV